MKKIWNLLFVFLLSFGAKAQYGYDITRDEVSGQTMFVGRCTFDDLTDEASFSWLNTRSNDYNPDPTVLAELKQKLPACKIVIFMGTWCEDTQNLLPKLYKTMLLTHCFTNYQMFGVDRNKISKENEQKTYGVSMVPTIIILRNGKELGRIVETTRTSIESDLLRITESEGKELQTATPAPSEEKAGVVPKSKKQKSEEDEEEEGD
jgi:hypothetical protein